MGLSRRRFELVALLLHHEVCASIDLSSFQSVFLLRARCLEKVFKIFTLIQCGWFSRAHDSSSGPDNARAWRKTIWLRFKKWLCISILRASVIKGHVWTLGLESIQFQAKRFEEQIDPHQQLKKGTSFHFYLEETRGTSVRESYIFIFVFLP